MSHRSHLTGISSCSFAAINRSVIFPRKLEDLTCRRTPFCDRLSLAAGGLSPAGRTFSAGSPCPNWAGGISLGLSLRETASQRRLKPGAIFLHVGTCSPVINAGNFFPWPVDRSSRFAKIRDSPERSLSCFALALSSIFDNLVVTSQLI